MRIFLLAVILSVTCSSILAQRKVSGEVQDSLQKPIPFVTARVYKTDTDIEPLKVTYTNDKGRFEFFLKDTGTYVLIISHTGFNENKQTFHLVDDAVILPPIQLKTTGKTLQNVTVTAKKPLIEQSDDKVIFNAEADPTAKTESAIDILKKTPFVTVDGDNNIQVNGQSNFKVLLNGRETAMFAQNVKEALKSFPGALITKIEVITSPSAKYDAEGVGGIINIVTKKKMKGYNGSVSAYYSQIGWYNGSINFSVKTGKLGVSLNGFTSGVNNLVSKSLNTTTALTPSIFSSRVAAGRRFSDNSFRSINGEISYELDSLNTISTYLNGWNARFTNDLDQIITTNYSSSASISNYNNQSETKSPSNSIGADYIKKFRSNKEKEFSVRFNADLSRSKQNVNSVQDNPSGSDRFVINHSLLHNRQYTIQSDLIQPLKQGAKIEIGVKAILRKATSDFQSMIKYDAVENYKVNTNNTDYFDYSQDIYSVYGTYGFKAKKTTFRLGIRTEHTNVEGDFITSQTLVRQSYLSVLPNLQASTRFSDKYTLVTTYSQRLQRPYIWNLNPFVNNNDSLNISFGNPDLDAQNIHSLSFQNRFSKGSTFFGITLTGSYSGNMITSFSSFDATTGITKTTSANIGKEYQLGISGNISTKFNKDWTLSVNGNVRYNKVKNKYLQSQQNSGIGGNAFMNTAYTITKKFSVSSYAGFFRSPVTIQGFQRISIWYGTGLVYKFFKEKLSANLSMANFLEKERDYVYTVQDPLFNMVTTNTQPFRTLAFSLTWNFGKLTENVSKKKGVSNDDLLGNSSN